MARRIPTDCKTSFAERPLSEKPLGHRMSSLRVHMPLAVVVEVVVLVVVREGMSGIRLLYRWKGRQCTGYSNTIELQNSHPARKEHNCSSLSGMAIIARSSGSNTRITRGDPTPAFQGNMTHLGAPRGPDEWPPIVRNSGRVAFVSLIGEIINGGAQYDAAPSCFWDIARLGNANPDSRLHLGRKIVHSSSVSNILPSAACVATSEELTCSISVKKAACAEFSLFMQSLLPIADVKLIRPDQLENIDKIERTAAVPVPPILIWWVRLFACVGVHIGILPFLKSYTLVLYRMLHPDGASSRSPPSLEECVSVLPIFPFRPKRQSQRSKCRRTCDHRNPTAVDWGNI